MKETCVCQLYHIYCIIFSNLAKKSLKKKNRYHDNRLSKREFRDFIHAIVEQMPGGMDESFDYFVEFLLSSVEVSHLDVSYNNQWSLISFKY